MIPIVGSCIGDLVKEAVKTKGVVGIAVCGYLPSVVFSSFLTCRKRDIHHHLFVQMDWELLL